MALLAIFSAFNSTSARHSKTFASQSFYQLHQLSPRSNGPTEIEQISHAKQGARTTGQPRFKVLGGGMIEHGVGILIEERVEDLGDDPPANPAELAERAGTVQQFIFGENALAVPGYRLDDRRLGFGKYIEPERRTLGEIARRGRPLKRLGTVWVRRTFGLGPRRSLGHCVSAVALLAMEDALGRQVVEFAKIAEHLIEK